MAPRLSRDFTWDQQLAIAQTNSDRRYQEFRIGFIQGLRNEENARRKINLLNLNASKSNLVLAHYRTIVNDDDVASRVFEEFKASGLIDKAIQAPQSFADQVPKFASLGYELFESLGVKGLRRLDYAEIRAYMQFVHKIFDLVPANVCKALLVGDVSGRKDESALFLLIMTKLPDSEVDAYLRLIRKSIFAEVRNFPSVKSITDAQRKLAESALEQTINKNFREHPRSQRLLAAALDLRTANDSDACQVGQLSIRSMLEMKGAVSEWQARLFIESMQL